MKKTKEEAAHTHQVILDSALKVFSSKGYAAARLEDIASHAGVTRGAIYWHFKDKYELFFSLYKQLSEKIGKRTEEILASEKTPLKKIHRLMQETFVYMEENQEFRSIEEISLYNAGIKEEWKEIIAIHSKTFLFIKGTLIKLLEDGIAKGELKDSLDPEVTALAMMSYVCGVKCMWLNHRAHFSLRDIGEQIIQVFLKGLVAS
jgi:AcrR family transcriptional regulator